ncbi:hypothetical protein RHGRI_004657 [Rhododendron griersonianum]|uniref:Uncharacterized protein n=1 Tax=Rhododendron griersonianum TaxID=479676 RepID=A0AAV6LA77_9ERIC|nr:hypothetical protein RHGRI_004657 [Rhododendron griersonianum]
MARTRRVAEVLWRLFNNRARTLADTIVSLFPPSRLCGSVLLERIVKRTIEMIISAQPSSSNVLCSDYVYDNGM